MADTPLPTDQDLASSSAALIDQMASHQNANTRRTYVASLRLWAAWHRLRFSRELRLPVAGEVLVQFLRDFLPRNPDLPAPSESALKGPATSTQHGIPLDIDQRLVQCRYKRSLGPLPLTSVRARLSALNLVHRQHGFMEPTNDPSFISHWKRFQQVSRGVPRRVRRGVGELSRGEFEDLVASCKDDTPGIRDRALLLVAWSTALRCGQLVEARLECVRLLDGHPILAVPAPSPRRNGRQGHRQDDTAPSLLTHKPISPEAFAALTVWRKVLSDVGINQGALFWVIGDGRPRAPMTQETIREMFTRRATLAQVDLARATPDSLRKGSLAHQLRGGRPLQELLKLAGLHRPANFMRI